MPLPSVRPPTLRSSPRVTPGHSARLRAVLVLGLGLAVMTAGGCARSTLRPGEIPATRPVTGVGQATFDERVEAVVVPPEDWKLDPPKRSDRHTHLVWLSPTRDTAYGVIYARLPIYGFATSMVHNIVLDKFLEEMEHDQGEAILLEKQWQPDAQRLAFEAEGGLYQLDALLTVRGLSAWVVYTGTRREGPRNESELELARRARDATQVGREAAESSQRN